MEIACKREAPDREPGEWDYGCACYESALKAVKNVPGAGKRILYIPIRWDMKFYLPSIITGVN